MKFDPCFGCPWKEQTGYCPGVEKCDHKATMNITVVHKCGYEFSFTEKDLPIRCPKCGEELDLMHNSFQNFIEGGKKNEQRKNQNKIRYIKKTHKLST